MKRRFTRILAAFALLVFMTPSMVGWGQVSSVVPADGNSYVVAAYVNSKYYALPCTTTNGGTLQGVEITLNSLNKVNTSDASGKVWTLEEGTESNVGQYYFKYTNGSSTYYLYKNGTSTSNYNFKVSTSSKNYWSFATNNTGYTVTAVDRGTNHLNIQCNNGTFRCNNTASAIILLEIGDAASSPSISANDVNIAYNSISGSIGYSVNNPVSGTNLTASVPSGSWLTLGSVTSDAVSFTCAVNEGAERTATVTLSYEGADDKEVTVTQAAAPVIYTTIPALFEAATNAGNNATDVNVTFGNWVVSGVAGSNVYVTDNTGNGFIIYKSSHGFSVNDKLSGTVSNTPLKLFKGSAEFTNLTSSTDGLSVSNDGEISVITNKTISDLGGVNTGAVIQLNNLTYDGTDLSDGTNTIKPYNSLYSSMSFTSGKTYNVTGVYLQYDNTKEILPRSATDIVEVTQEYTLTVNASAYVDIITFVGETTDPGEEGPTTLQVNNGTEVGLSVSVTEGYLLTLVVDDIDVTSQLDETGYYTFIMPTHNVTVTATAELAPLYSVVLCDDNTTLTEASYGDGVTLPTRNGDETYTFAGWSTTNVEAETTTAPTIIPAGPYHPVQSIALYPVYTRTEGGGSTTEWHLTELNAVDAGVYALLTPDHHAFNGEINDSGRGELTTTTFSFDNNVAVSAPADICEITFTAVNGGFTMSNSDKGYLYAKGKNAGNLAWRDSDENYWNYNASNWQYSENFSKAKTSLRSMSNSYFNTYASNVNGSAALILAKKVEVSSSITYYTSLLNSTSLTIAADQWYLISSPVGEVNPIGVGNMVTDQSFALYRFNQQGDTDGKEWINYKGGAFNLEFGKGYLYANEAGCMLSFTGTPVSFSNNDDLNVLPLDYHEGADFAGYNLLGNPFNQKVYVDGWPYYVMNSDGDAIIEGHSGINPMQGFFVIADGEEEVEVVTLTLEPTGEKGASVALNVSRNRGNVIDRVRVRFGESRQLPKFQLFENSTKVYIPQNGKDYAVVRSEGQGELPVNFRASENGTYTLSMDVENMDMNYLHLIDNMTGMDVDLLQTPSYTFEAKVNDYESRFRLVFAANNVDGVSTGSTTFAFYSNGSWIINNAGEATLQVVDLTGRILSSETVNGSVSKTINAVPGVYMLRLINGENVNVQKIVVR